MGDVEDDQYLTTAQVAAMLRVSPRTVSRWAARDRLPFVTTARGQRRFPRRAVEDMALALRPDE